MITIIITACKEEKTIGRAIEAIIKQKIKEKYELFVVAPDKGTLEKAKKYQEKYPQIKLIKDPGKGKPYALNLAFKKAEGKIFVLTDGDVFIGKNAIANLFKQFKGSKIGAVTGHPISLNSRRNMLGYWSHLLTDAAHEERIEKVKKNQFLLCSGYLYAIRNGIIKSIPEEVLAEDAIISHMIAQKGCRIGYAPNAFVYVKYPTTFSDWIKQKKRSAGGYLQIDTFVKGKKKKMRSFWLEVKHFWFPFKYAKNLKEVLWSFFLLWARLYLWLLIFIDLNLKKKSLKQIWVEVKTTK